MSEKTESEFAYVSNVFYVKQPKKKQIFLPGCKTLKVLKVKFVLYKKYTVSTKNGSVWRMTIAA